jgi:hypothetical protein
MSSHEVMKSAITEIGVKAVAANLGLSESLVYKWCQEAGADEADEKSGARNPLDRLVALYKLTGDKRLVTWLCEQADGYYVENPRRVTKEEVDGAVFRHTQAMVKSFSELLNEVSDAIDNGDGVDTAEAKRIRREWEDLKRQTESFVSGCENGAFAIKK